MFVGSYPGSFSFAPRPCPFCGEEPEIYPSDPDKEGHAWGLVACVNALCPAQPRVHDGAPVSDSRGSAAYKALAVERWNSGGIAQGMRKRA